MPSWSLWCHCNDTPGLLQMPTMPGEQKWKRLHIATEDVFLWHLKMPHYAAQVTSARLILAGCCFTLPAESCYARSRAWPLLSVCNGMPQSYCSCRACTTGYTTGWLVTQWYPKLSPAPPEGEDSAHPLIHQTYVPRVANKGPDTVFPTTLWSWQRILVTCRHQSMPLLPHSPIHWMTWTLSMPSYGREAKRQLVQTPSFSWGPPYTHIYLLAFLPTRGNYPLRLNHIGMSATICPVLVKHCYMVLYGSWIVAPKGRRKEIIPVATHLYEPPPNILSSPMPSQPLQ